MECVSVQSQELMDILDVVYTRPEQITRDMALALVRQTTADDDDGGGECWMALALVQNLDGFAGCKFDGIPGLEVCALRAMERGFREARDLLYEVGVEFGTVLDCTSVRRGTSRLVSIREFVDIVELAYVAPESVTFAQAQTLEAVGHDAAFVDCASFQISGIKVNLKGQAWMSLAMVQNLGLGGRRHSQVIDVEFCLTFAMEHDFREAQDVLHECRKDLFMCGVCLHCGNPSFGAVDDMCGSLDPRDLRLKQIMALDIGLQRIRLEELYAQGDFAEAADILYELDCDSIPDRWEMRTHLEFPARVRASIWIWLLVANRMNISRDVRTLAGFCSCCKKLLEQCSKVDAIKLRMRAKLIARKEKDNHRCHRGNHNNGQSGKSGPGMKKRGYDNSRRRKRKRAAKQKQRTHRPNDDDDDDGDDDDDDDDEIKALRQMLNQNLHCKTGTIIVLPERERMKLRNYCQYHLCQLMCTHQ